MDKEYILLSMDKEYFPIGGNAQEEKNKTVHKV